MKCSYLYCSVWSFLETHDDEFSFFTEKEVVVDEIADMTLNEKV